MNFKSSVCLDFETNWKLQFVTFQEDEILSLDPKQMNEMETASVTDSAETQWFLQKHLKSFHERETIHLTTGCTDLSIKAIGQLMEK